MVIEREANVVALFRIAVTAGGAIVLAIAGLVPAHSALLALVVIAIPSHAGKLVELLRGKK